MLWTGMSKGRTATASRKTHTTPKTAPTARPSPAKAVNMAFQMEDTNPEVREQTNFDALMQAITTCQTTLTGKFETMQLDIILIKRDMDCFRTWLTERRVGEAEDTLQVHGVLLCMLET